MYFFLFIDSLSDFFMQVFGILQKHDIICI